MPEQQPGVQEPTQEKPKGGSHRLSQADRLKGSEAAKRKRLERQGLLQSRPQHSALSILVPVDLAAAVTGLQTRASKGDPAAVRALLELLTRYPTQTAADATAIVSKPLESMTPEELDYAEAYLTHRIARAQRRQEGLKAASVHARENEGEGGGRLPPEQRDSD